MGSECQTNEVLVLHAGRSVHLTVPGPEGVSQPLDLDAAHDEVVESHSSPSRVVTRDQVLGESWCEPELRKDYCCLVIYLSPTLYL